jgi:transcriptional regulator GlxA family with amidase domain
MIDEALQKSPHYQLLCVSDILRLLSLLQMAHESQDEEKRKPWKSIAYAVQHMNRYCDSDLKLEHYAAMCCMSKYHFLRVFKEVTGSTPVEYRNSIRIKKAEEMLENGQLSISEIGEALGKSETWARVTFFRVKQEILERLEGSK